MTSLRSIPAIALVAFGAAAPAVAQAPDAAPAYVRPEPPGQLVEVAPGRRLHILCKGEGEGPTVVFEEGMSQFTANTAYGAAQDLIAPFARVCTYDRAGLGWSDPAPENWTHAGMAADLHALLAAADIETPVVLVAHSMGGVVARTDVVAHPDDAIGLILIDAAAGSDFAEHEASIAANAANLDTAIDAPAGVPVVNMPSGTPAEISMSYTPEAFRGLKREIEALLGMTSEARATVPGSLGDLKLIVIARGEMADPPTESDLSHREGQEELLTLSSDSVLIVAENSGHLIPRDEPQVVADATRRILEAIRDGAPLE